ncbi:PKD domain-containing protein [Neolewinella persica]|uniref:PKD domain-containing protein n=1 Tax=Neolewinella persica TaxID=70998 RepID=UPI00035ED490|nr:PKD domain-containing protein [Neolewinella persica]
MRLSCSAGYLGGLILSFLLFSTVNAQDTSAPTIQICGGDQFVCLQDSTLDLCVTVAIDPDFEGIVDSLSITWGDGSDPQFFYDGTASFNRTHRYDFSDFYLTCQYELSGTFVILTSYIAGADNPNQNIIPLTVRNPPQAMFGNFPSIVCQGETVDFGASACPAEALTLEFDFGNGYSDTTTNTYPNTGVFPVTLRATNPCGQDSVTGFVTVIEGPNIIAFPDSNLTGPNTMPYQVCLDSVSPIRVNASMSTGLTDWSWTVSPDTGAVVADTSALITTVSFTEAGLYTVLFTGLNEDCGVEEVTSFQVEVVNAAILRLAPQEDACLSLSYSPSPLNQAATYLVNGDTIQPGDFPVNLPPGSYRVDAEIIDTTALCATPPLVDSFNVTSQEVAAIGIPDTTVCDQSQPFALRASPATGGIWRVDNREFDGIFDPAAYSEGDYVVSYGRDSCLISDQVVITVVGASVTVPEDLELCDDDAPVTFSGAPSGGLFSGAGVQPDGFFDPGLTGEGVYPLTYRFESAALPGCSSQDTFTVTVAELVTSFEVSDCDGNELCFTAPVGVAYDSLRWIIADSTLDVTSGDACFTFPGPGDYPVRLEVQRGNCTAFALQNIRVAPAPAPSFALVYDPDRCSGLEVSIVNNSNSGAELTYNWMLNGETFSDLRQPPSLTLASVIRDSVFEISLALSNGCETRQFFESVVTRPLPQSRFSTDQVAYCSGDTIQLSSNVFGRPDSYRWVVDGMLLSTDSIPPLIVRETGGLDTVEVCLQIASVCGRDTLCRDVIVTPSDVSAFFNVSATTLCVGDTLFLMSGASNGVPVLYDFGNGQGSSQPNPYVVYELPGTYRISQRAFGCGEDEFLNQVEVLAAPNASFRNPNFVCPNEPVEFINTSANGLAVSWDFGDSTALSEDFSPIHTYTTPGSYRVCLTVTNPDPAGCDRQVCQVMEVFPTPEAGFMASDSVCQNGTVLFSSTAAGGLACTYDFGDGNFGVSCTAENTYTSSGTFLATQTVTDLNGCRDSSSQRVFIRPVPQPDFSFAVRTACDSDSVRFTNETTRANGFFWDFGDGTTSTATNPIHRYPASGPYTVTLRATQGGICFAESSQEIIIREAPIADLEVDVQDVCFGEFVNFSSLATGDVEEHFWNFGDGTASFDPNPSHEFTSPGTYEVVLTVAGDTRCSDSTSVFVTVHPPVIAEFDRREEVICNGDSSGLLSLIVTSGTPPYDYDWSHGRNTPIVDQLTAGTYSVSITDREGCKFQTEATFTETAPLTAIPSVTRVTCANGADGAVALDIDGGVRPYTVSWTGGTSDQNATGLFAGAYLITVTDVNGCRFDVPVTVPENPPILSQDSVQQISCYGAMDGAIRFRSISGGVPPYQINIVGTNYQESGLGISRFDGLGPDFYSVELIDSAGCVLDFERQIIEPDPVSVDILEDTIFLELGEEVALNTILFNADDPIFRWTPSAGLDCTDCQSPIARPFSNTTYLLSMQGDRGCPASDEVYIRVNLGREVYIPNTFTPNADGRNDIFRVRSNFEKSIETIEFFEVRDRGGQLLFSAEDFPPNDLAFGWDGRFNGTKVVPGYYVYQAKVRYVDGETKELSGSVRVFH